MNDSPTPGCLRQPENSAQLSESSTQRVAKGSPKGRQRVAKGSLDRLAAHDVPAEGQILLHAADHGAAGRMVAEYANTVGASTIVVGAPTHGGLPALIDGSATRELWRHARSNVLIVNPDAPDGVPAEDLWRELAKD